MHSSPRDFRSVAARPARAGALEAGALLLALATAAPIVALALIALGGDTNPAVDSGIAHLVQTVLPRYALTTFALALVVLTTALLVGVSSAWLVAAYEFPGRGWLAWALVLPLAMPAFVMAYAYTDFFDTSGPFQGWLRGVTGWRIGEYWFPDIRSIPGAGLFLGLALYPYVYLLARAAFAERSPSLAEAARSLGLGRRALWWRVAWPVARPAVVAGCALVLMETLADFGVVTYFAVDTFTAGIYRAWQGLGDRTGAARLALVLLVLVGGLIWIERRQRGRMQFFSRAHRVAPRERLAGGAALRATAVCLAPILLGFALPAALLIRAWLGEGGQLDARLAGWLANTATLALLGAAATLPAALLAAYAARLGPGRSTRAAIAMANSGYALPGIVLGVGLLVVVGAIDRGLGQTLFGRALLGGTVFAVVYSYLVRFFAVAFQGLDSGLKRISPAMDQSARSLGRTPIGVLRDVHWPLLRRSVATAGLLVMIDCLKELPATLVLRPFDFDTLAVIAYQFASDERLAQAAAPSLLIVALGLAPVLLLTRSTLRP